MDECIHGTNREWCSFCTPPTSDVPPNRAGEYGFHGGRTKQDLLSELCDELGIIDHRVGTGSSLPSEVFREVSSRYGLSGRSMPEIGNELASRAGLTWGPDCDSTGSVSGGGSTVTADGLEIMIQAVRALR